MFIRKSAKKQLNQGKEFPPPFKSTRRDKHLPATREKKEQEKGKEVAHSNLAI
jgi:hypothetical protein